MKRFYFRFRIMLMTFALSLASVNFFNWFDDYWNEVPVALPQVESASPVEMVVINRSTGNKNVFRLSDPNAFSISGGGCGSPAARYIAYNWQSVAKSTSGHNKIGDAKKELDLRIKDASAILESNLTFDKNTKAYKQRIILELRKEDKAVNIINYDGRNYIDIISAPSLKLALEFEQWEEYRNNHIHLSNENGRKQN